MMTSEKIGAGLTVVVPTLNSASTLDWTLASLRSAAGIRVIVADSYSTDGTLDVCKRWDVEVINVPAGNMYRAINAGLRLAETEWLAYVNSDDWVFTSAYIRMLAFAALNQYDFVYGSADYVDLSGRFLFSIKPTRGDVVVRLLRSGMMAICQPTAIFRRTAFDALGGFDERYRSAADLDFFCRAAILKMAFHRFDSQPVAAFRLHQAQISAAHSNWDQKEKLQIKERLHFGSGLGNKWAFLRWRIANLPWYAARILRSYELSGRLTLQKSSAPPIHE
jgi:glycosyltransferase involved in cell wall biosynthesis